VLSNWLYVVLGKNISYDFCVVILNATGNICYCRMKSVKRQVNDCSVIYRGETRSFLEYHDAWFVLKQHANLDYSTNSLKQQFAGRHIFIAFVKQIFLYITNLVCYTYFHWFFSPECQHIFGKHICASGNIDPKPGMSHYIPCLIAE
jgi:hypothetical protein